MSLLYRTYDIVRDFWVETITYNDLAAPVHNLQGRVILITGGNTGLGRESARQLALMKPAKIILTARNMEKGSRAVSELTAATGFNHFQLESLDLCSMASVNRFSRRLLDTESRLDVLMCNAGLGSVDHVARKTEDGFDEMFQGNNLGHYLLTQNLMPLLEAAPKPARIIYLSSLASKFLIHFDINMYANAKRADSNEYYGVTKFMAVIMAQGVAEQVKQKGIVVNSVHPGTVNTEFASRYQGFMKNYVFPVMYKLFERTIDQGAATQVYLASSPEAGTVTGKYWSNMLVWNANPTADNPQLGRQFVELCDELIRKHKL